MKGSNSLPEKEVNLTVAAHLFQRAEGKTVFLSSHVHVFYAEEKAQSIRFLQEYITRFETVEWKILAANQHSNLSQDFDWPVFTFVGSAFFRCISSLLVLFAVTKYLYYETTH